MFFQLLISFDYFQVAGGDPLLKLIAVDWFKLETSRSKVALHPKSIVQVLYSSFLVFINIKQQKFMLLLFLLQSEAGKKLPFILVVNLQVCILTSLTLTHLMLLEVIVILLYYPFSRFRLNQTTA